MEWIEIRKWMQIQTDTGLLVPIILFEPTLEFLVRIKNSLEDIYYTIDIIGTDGIYDGVSFTAILDKTTIGGYYAFYIQIPFTIYPCREGYFRIVPDHMG